MPDELPGFQTRGLSWEERAAQCAGEQAVYAPDDARLSRWLGLVHGECLREALALVSPRDTVLDFGCGIGDKTVCLAARAARVVGVEITAGMLERAKRRCAGLPVVFEAIDGVHLPLAERSIDLVWVSGVLRYSLLVPEPRHHEIVAELHRVLRPGGHVCNLEMYVDRPASVFTADFLARGFELLEQRPVHVYRSRLDRLALGPLGPLFRHRPWASLSVALTRRRCHERALGSRLRDYYFVYRR